MVLMPTIINIRKISHLRSQSLPPRFLEQANNCDYNYNGSIIIINILIIIIIIAMEQILLFIPVYGSWNLNFLKPQLNGQGLE